MKSPAFFTDSGLNLLAKYGGTLDTFKVQPCCTDTGKGIITLFNDSASKVFHAFSIASPVHSKIIYMNGTFTFDRSVAFIGCDIRMGEKAKIIVLNNDTMQLNNNICNHIHAGCNYMWSGIHIQAGGWFISEIAGGNLIEDADSAIDAMNTPTKQATFQMTSTYLNKNYIAVVVEPYKFAYTGFIHRSVITCRDFSTLVHPSTPLCFYTGSVYWKTFPFTNLIAPLTAIRSHTGLDMFVVNSLTENGENVYDNLDMGIHSRSSNLTVERDTFEHINPHDSVEGAIIAVGGIGSFIPNQLRVGISPTLANLFTDCTIGVYADLNFSVTQVIYNTFNFVLPATNNPSETRAVWLSQTGLSGKDNVLVRYNNMSNAYVGVECDRNVNITANINNNTISSPKACTLSSIPEPTAIVIDELTPSIHTTLYNVFANAISAVRQGILAMNVYNANIYSNSISLETEVGGCPPDIGYGVQLDNGSVCNISSNHISTSFVVPNQFYTGISVSISPTTTICSNVISGMYHGINCAGASPSSTVASNSLAWAGKASAVGILITSSGVISAQGSLTHPSDNTWTTSYPCHSDVILSIAGSSPFYIRNNTSGGTYSVLPACPASLFAISPITGSSLSCSPPIILEDTLLGEIAESQLNYPLFPDTSMRLSKQSLTHIIWENSVSLTDTVLKHFNDSIQLTSMGQILAADSLTNDSTGLILPSLLSTVSGISPASNIEANMKRVTGIYLQSLVMQHDSLTLMQLNELRVIANKCPFEDGVGVYEARAYLIPYDGVQYYKDSCTGNRDDDERMLKKENKNETLNVTDVVIYPNPNNGTFTLKYTLESNQSGKVTLYSTTGQEVGTYILNESSGKMNISNPSLTNGVYFYELTTTGNTVKVGKVIIIK